MRHVPLPGVTIIAAIRFVKITGKAMGTSFAQKMSKVSSINALRMARGDTPTAKLSTTAYERGNATCPFGLCAWTIASSPRGGPYIFIRPKVICRTGSGT